MSALRSAQSNAEGGAHSPAPHALDATRTIGIVVGGGGALAVVLQHVLQTGFSTNVWPDAFFIAAFGATLWLVRKVQSLPPNPQAVGTHDSHDLAEALLDGGSDQHQSANDSAGVRTTTIVCLIVATASLFSMLPFYEAVIRTSDGGTAVFYEWHRLFLAAGYLVMGAASYIGWRHAASMTMLVTALLAIVLLVQTLKLESGPTTMILFYFLLGAAIAWSNIAFMSIAPQFANSAPIASAGRILLVVATFIEIPIRAIGELPLLPALTIELALFAVAMISMLRGSLLDLSTVTPEAEVPESAAEDRSPSLEERVSMLGNECDLNDRELEVLSSLVLTEEKNQKIASDLGISRRQLQTYVSRIYEKTGTTTRAGLVLRMYGEAQPR